MSGAGAKVPLSLSLVTPEQVAIPFTVASLGSRAGAFLLDMLVLGAAMTALAVVFAIASGGSSGYLEAIVVLALFVGRNFYFSFSEIRFQGQTFGKRRSKIRVIARDGGPLTTSMVFARNLTRDLEFFIPLTVLIAPEHLFGDAPFWGRLVSLGWLTVVVLLPLFNRHRARVGDLVAGTVVVCVPEARLLDDLARTPGPTSARRPDFTFTPEQLDKYGIRELQILEDVLRHPVPDPDLVDTIAQKIKRKIGWARRAWDVPPEPFLRAFYAAQRARLEHKMLLGKRQEHKVE